MSTVVVVAKTRMRGGAICVGAHDLADFRSLRLLRRDGSRLLEDVDVAVGDELDLEYVERMDTTPPHVEDVLVQDGARRVRRNMDIKQLVTANDIVWRRVEELFDGCLNFTDSGSGYVPAGGPLPPRSTGYWAPSSDLTLFESYGKPRYGWRGAGPLKSIPYVGVDDPPAHIRVGALVRLSLSHVYEPEGSPRGFWLQLSGWF